MTLKLKHIWWKSAKFMSDYLFCFDHVFDSERPYLLSWDFRCILGRLLNLFNFISIMDQLWHMGDRHLVTRTPDRMLRHWGRVQMDTTYMGMFWSKTLWLVVSVVCGVGSWALDPQRGCEALLDPGVEWARPVCDQLARESPYGLNNIETDPTSSHHLWYTTTSTPIYLWWRIRVSCGCRCRIPWSQMLSRE